MTVCPAIKPHGRIDPIRKTAAKKLIACYLKKNVVARTECLRPVSQL
jgi:hypothetical protein